ncbi:MAG: hypothetical protein JWN73_3596 [Betaproteobacteria bacterium]|nr:hypothetical protein [Betaproteobacteria bacterium]
MLAHGREILIAGEHEDHYDPDFHIYNDVVVKHPDGRIDIYGYPREVFPPTDFHSATLAGDQIVLIGNLGNESDRQPTATQVLVLDLADFSIRRIEAGGERPGWIHRQQALLAPDGRSIRITKGELVLADDKSLAENFDDWTLDLGTWTWARSEHRRWQTWTVRREDKKPSQLWNLRQLLWLRGWKNDKAFSLQFDEGMQQTTAEMGRAPDIDAIATLYQPPMAHEVLPQDEDESQVHRVLVDDVVVRYVEQSRTIRVVVEGQLPSSTIQMMQADLLEKLQWIENASWEYEY